MSFRMFLYYSALSGGWAAYFGWIAGKLAWPQAPDTFLPSILFNGVRFLFAGLFIALGVAVVDALWNLSRHRLAEIGLRSAVAIVIGAMGGLLGGMIGEAMYWPTRLGASYIIGWIITGTLVGVSIGQFEWLAGLFRGQNAIAAERKMLITLAGGAAGGLLGGLLSYMLTSALVAIFGGINPNNLWSPWAMGFVALGMCIGLLTSLAQVVFKDAWIRIENGPAEGRERILSKEKTTIGRSKGCDIYLFGDNKVEMLHAVIFQIGSRYLLEDASSTGGTFVNGHRISGRTLLNTGDLIQIGNYTLCFHRRANGSAKTVA